MTAAEHPDDLLSAHVDGELDAATAQMVSEHVAECPMCRHAEAALREARALVRSLPTEDAAPVIDGFLARHRQVIRLGTGFVGAAAVILGALGLTAATHREPVVPDVAALVAAHRAAPPDELDVERKEAAPYSAPPGLIGSRVSLSRQEAYDGSDLGAVVYRDGPVAVTVYQEPGRLDWGRMPPGEVREIAGEPVWFRPGRPTVAVAEKGDLVVTVVSDDRAGVMTAVGGMPPWRRREVWDRLHDACQRLTEVFALGG